MTGRLVAALLIAVGCARALPSRNGSLQAPPALVLTNVTLVNVRTGQLRPKSTVVVTGNRIEGVYDRAPNSRDGPGTLLIEGGGRYLIPGLIDTHVHVLSEWENAPIDPADYFGWILAGGVTTIRDMSVDGYRRVAPYRAQQEDGTLLAPRIYVSAGPDRDGADPWADLLRYTGARDPAEAIRRFAALKIDGLKLLNPPRDMAIATLAAARDTAVPVYGHAVWTSPDRPSTYDNFALEAVDAGLSGLVHALGPTKPAGVDDRGAPNVPKSTPEGRRQWVRFNQMSWQRISAAQTERLIAAMVGRGVWYEPTRLVNYYWNHQAQYETSGLSPHHPWRIRVAGGAPEGKISAEAMAAEEAEARFIRRFHAAGGRILAGTDDVPLPPYGVTEEMRALVAAGLSPLAALQAATIDAARALGWSERLGVVEAGRLADLVLLEANPLVDITNVRRLHSVVANGRLLDRKALDSQLTAVGSRR